MDESERQSLTDGGWTLSKTLALSLFTGFLELSQSGSSSTSP